MSYLYLTAIVFYDKPFLKFERLLETYHAFVPKGIRSFLSAIPVWIKEKLFMRKLLNDELRKLGPIKCKLLFTEHHLSHAASAFFPSPFEDAAILTVDGVGEWATTLIGYGQNNKIDVLRQLDFPHSLGLLYSAFTYFCGFRVNSGEYKLMGLAPYGSHGSQEVNQYKKIIKRDLIDIREDGSFFLNMDFFNYAVGLTMCVEKKWEKLFLVKKREPESDLTQLYMNLALAIQEVTEEIIFKLAKTAKKLTNSDYLVMAGGVALNCVANGKLLKQGIFKDIWIQPAAGDAGGALGAACAAYYIWLNHKREKPAKGDAMQGAYLGPKFLTDDAKKMARKYDANYTEYKDFDVLCLEVADHLKHGDVVGWFQGRMEYGPRALGNRSIIGNPCNPEMQKRLNLKIKYREGFRPFAPSVLEEDIDHYFELDRSSPYMLLVAPILSTRRHTLPAGYANMGIYERLYIQRSDMPAITHVDYTARIQSVSASTNPRYWKLIDTFKALTGYSVIVNTSFNVRGEPIVCTPEDAYRCFMRTEMDYLVVDNLLFNKAEQPHFEDKEQWQEKFILD